MNNLLNVLLEFIKPLIRLAFPVVGIISLITGAIKNPEGAVNTFLVKMIDLVAAVFPATPEEIKVSSIINSIDIAMPLVGKAVIYEVFETIAIIASVAAVVKIYKLIPFKAT